MSLELAAIPLAFVAGIVGVLSPCVWPLVPVVTSAAASSGRMGPVYLAAGLSVSFAVAGTLLTWLLVSLGVDPEFFRVVAAVLLLTIGVVILVPALSDAVTLRLSMLSGKMRFNTGGSGGAVGGQADAPRGASGQFAVGALLGIVWLPCVGPTLGAAIALASMGQDLVVSFVVMLAYGIGTAGVLLLAGYASTRLLAKWRPALMSGGGFGKKLLGGTLVLLGLMVLTGVDKILETWAVGILPEWVYGM